MTEAGTIDKLTPDAQSYARTLIAAGFTVYAPAYGHPQNWFHYSRNGLFGTFGTTSGPLQGAYHHMPITPSVAFGSSMWIDAKGLDPYTVAYAELITCETNSNYLVGTQRNATPWGIGTRYLPVN